MITAYRLAFTGSLSKAFRPRGAPARWNTRGIVVIYTAEHPALAALEILGGREANASLEGYHLYRCTFPEDVVQEARDALKDYEVVGLAIEEVERTRGIGDAWVRSQESVALRVPSVVAPVIFDDLLNPDHANFQRVVTRERVGPFEVDDRVLELVRRAR